LNIAQELFLVLFAILYGVMLQSIGALRPFPLGRTCRGYMNQMRKVDPSSNEWLVRMWRKRVGLSIVFLNILPLLYFFISLRGLNTVSISHDFSSVCDFVNVFFIFWSAVGVFGFYRIYIAIAAWRWETLFCDVKIEGKIAMSFDVRAQLFWGLFFYLLPPLHYLFLVNFRPALLGTLGIYPTLFLVWLIYVIDC